MAGSHPVEAYFDVPFNRDKISVWTGLLGNGTVIGPLCYQSNLNGEKNGQLLEQQIIPQIREFYDAQFDNVRWMQDRAPCHMRVLVSNYLRETFQNRIIGFEREWPPRSPDLTSCDFFFSGAS